MSPPGRLIVVENPLRGLVICEWLDGPSVDSDAAGGWLRRPTATMVGSYGSKVRVNRRLRGDALQTAIEVIEGFEPIS